jgi:plastocyanin
LVTRTIGARLGMLAACRVGCAGLAVAALLTPTTATEPGRIVGQIRLAEKRAGRPLRSGAYPGRHIAPQGAAGPELANVLVWLRDAPPAATVPLMTGEIRQRGESFVPHVLATTVGSTVRFPNDDPFFHNVFSLSKAGTFDLGRYPKGDSRARTFTQPGIVKVFCHLHSHMTALIAVFDHPYFAQANADGTFVIEHVPPGMHTVTAWHERAGDTDAVVSVEPGATARVEVVVPVLEP